MWRTAKGFNNCQNFQHSLGVKTDNCTSLQVFPDPPDLCRLSNLGLNFVNCLSTETRSSFEYHQLVIPGSEILEWFNNQSVGDSVTEKLPSDACNSKWIGFAVCALIVPHDNPSAVPEDPHLDPDTCQIWCRWNNYGTGYSGVGVPERQFVSDHLLLVVLPSPFGKPENCLEVNFVFKITRAVGYNICMKVKKCGVRTLYEHDTEELISKMNQSKSSISLYEEGMDEQEGAMVKAASSALKQK